MKNNMINYQLFFGKINLKLHKLDSDSFVISIKSVDVFEYFFNLMIFFFPVIK